MTEITLPTAIKIQDQDKEENKATIVVDGCYPGYGVTLANSLRRILLSSLKGAAVTNYKIESVDHEFTTIPKVMEDAIQIGLNLKQIRFKLEDYEKEHTATLKAEGEKKVTAGDLDTPTGVKVVNENAPILTLTEKDAELNMEVTINSGYGLESAEERKDEKLAIGTIALDAFYSPVRKVSYDIEEMRIGERTDYNRILMAIKTDGTIEPAEAFQSAARILKDQFAFLEKEKIEQKEKEEKKTKKEAQEEETKSASEIMVEDLEIPTRVVNILKDNRIKSAAGLTQRKKESLIETEGLGKKSVEKIEKALKKHDLELK